MLKELIFYAIITAFICLISGSFIGGTGMFLTDFIIVYPFVLYFSKPWDKK